MMSEIIVSLFPCSERGSPPPASSRCSRNSHSRLCCSRTDTTVTQHPSQQDSPCSDTLFCPGQGAHLCCIEMHLDWMFVYTITLSRSVSQENILLTFLLPVFFFFTFHLFLSCAQTERNRCSVTWKVVVGLWCGGFLFVCYFVMFIGFTEGVLCILQCRLLGNK